MHNRYRYGSKPDYSSTPSAAEYDRRCFAVADHEVDCIHHVFDMHGVNASVNPQISIVTRQFFGYAIDVHGGKRGRVQDVMSVQREIANAISSTRGEPTPVRIQELPLMIEVANPWPQPLNYMDAPLKVGESRMLAGIEYDAYAGRKPYVLEFDDAVGSILVAGLPGSGKSTLISMMLVTMATSTSPVNLRLALVDLKGKSLPRFGQLPHAVTAAATSFDSAAMLVDAVYAEVIWRRDNPGADVPRLVLAIDELAELRNDKTTVDRLNSIIALGREMHVHCLLATQYPTKEVLGGLNTVNINIKIAGVLNDARTAAYVTGREGTGAHKLPPKTGSFIAVNGNQIRRFQAFLLPPEIVTSQIAVMADGWSERLNGRPLPQALHGKAQPVTRRSQPAALPVTVGYDNQPQPVITGDAGETLLDEPVFDADEDDEAVTGDAGYGFPIGAFRPLTGDECAAVRRMAKMPDYQHQGKPSRNRLVAAVYGSKSPERLAEIDRALAGDVDDSKIIRLPQRAAQR